MVREHLHRILGRARATGLALALLCGAGLAACSTNPATGESNFTAFMSESDEARIGAQAHSEIVQEFGGVYDNPALQAYVNNLGQYLATTSERKDVQYRFTILNSPVPNAFALPGGYIYVTRGLMALANDEAELAGVLGHEIGHVAARHSAQRYSQSILAQVGLAGLAIATGSPGLANMAGAGAQLYLLSNSREDEFEADVLGVRYISRANFDPNAMASFLSQLQRETDLSKQLSGASGIDDYNVFSTHPRTMDRVRDAISAAQERPVQQPIREHESYLQKIDGMLYGDDPKEGYIRGQRFLHKDLRIGFEVPQGFRLYNSSARVVAKNPNGAQILFELAPNYAGQDIVEYLAYQGAGKLRLSGLERIDVNGLPGATGTTRVNTDKGVLDLRIVVIATDASHAYRFLFVTPPDLTESLSTALRTTTYSFHRLSDQEVAQIRPLRIRLVRFKQGDTVENLARSMPYDEAPAARFRVLNGLNPGEQPPAGALLKIIAE